MGLLNKNPAEGIWALATPSFFYQKVYIGLRKKYIYS